MRAITEQYDYPFERPVIIDPETLDMKTGSWAVKLSKKTRAGNISEKDTVLCYITYCPWCGEKLMEDGEEA